MDRKSKYIGLMAVAFIVTVGLFFILVNMKDTQISEQTDKINNLTFNNIVSNAIILTYQDHLCKYESLYDFYNITDIWTGNIDNITIRKSQDTANETIIVFQRGCYNSTGREQIVTFYRYPPAQPFPENQTTQNNMNGTITNATIDQ